MATRATASAAAAAAPPPPPPPTCYYALPKWEMDVIRRVLWRKLLVGVCMEQLGATLCPLDEGGGSCACGHELFFFPFLCLTQYGRPLCWCSGRDGRWSPVICSSVSWGYLFVVACCLLAEFKGREVLYDTILPILLPLLLLLGIAPTPPSHCAVQTLFFSLYFWSSSLR